MRCSGSASASAPSSSRSSCCSSSEPLYGVIWRRFHPSFALFSLVRLAVVGALLLGPTILMGATLPVLAEHLARVGGHRPTAAALYTLNLIGAVVGVALAGFVLLPTLGVRGTIIAGALLNIGVGVAVLGLPPLPEESAPEAQRTEPGAVPRLLALAATVSGALAMATQVAWTRVLTLVVGSTTYALTSVLLIYLLALGVGSASSGGGASRRRAPSSRDAASRAPSTYSRASTSVPPPCAS